MLTKEQITNAIRYNSKKVGKAWSFDSLPIPFGHTMPWPEVVAWICAYQAKNKLEIDGKIGPTTLGIIRVDSTKKEKIIVEGSGPSNCVIINGERHRLPF